MSGPTDAEIEAEIDRLRSMPKAELRVRYRALFKSELPKAFGPNLLRRSMAYRIQDAGLWRAGSRHQTPPEYLMAQETKSKDGRIVVPRRI